MIKETIKKKIEVFNMIFFLINQRLFRFIFDIAENDFKKQ